MSCRKKPRDTVLIVDDSPETLSMLTDALDEADLTVLVALGGEQALALLEKVTPDIILMDALMPGVDGFETCRRIKQQAELRHLPVIFMTGLSDTAHIVEGLEAGGVDYVTKPIIPEELIARMRVHLANARLTQSTRAALDRSGRFLLAIEGDGGLSWCTPQAAQLLDSIYAGFREDNFRFPFNAEELRTQDAGRATQYRLREGASEINIEYVGEIGADEYLIRLSLSDAPTDIERLRDELSITLREAEVTAWLAEGKSNRDIADILGLSPRTVNKHLEQIFRKLGVENRTAAAAIALKTLGNAKP